MYDFSVYSKIVAYDGDTIISKPKLVRIMFYCVVYRFINIPFFIIKQSILYPYPACFTG